MLSMSKPEPCILLTAALLLGEEIRSLGLWVVLLALPQLYGHPCYPHDPDPLLRQGQSSISLWL